MDRASLYGYIEIVKFCAERGATNFDECMDNAAECGHIDIVKFCAPFYFGKIHLELLRFHHKRNFYKKISDELLPVA